MDGKYELLKAFENGQLLRPVYHRDSSLNLAVSLARVCGLRPHYPGLGREFENELREFRHIVFVLIDGLGVHLLRRLAPDGFLRSHMRRTLQAVFPSTTAAALTTMVTLLPPAEHGIFAWYLYLKEVGMVTTILPFTARLGGAPLSSAGLHASTVFTAKSWLQSAQRDVYYFSPAVYADSDFARFVAGQRTVVPFDNYHEALQKVADYVQQAHQGSCYCYVYLPYIDSLSHAHGWRHPKIQQELELLENALEQMSNTLHGHGVCMIITGDHGQIEVPPQAHMNLNYFPEFTNLLTMPLSGEPRVPFLYIRLGRKRKFKYLADKLFSQSHFLLRAEEAMDIGLFGRKGKRNDYLYQRIGDYLLIPKNSAVIHDFLPGQRHFFLTGYHGALSAGEMQVPLIVQAC